MNREQTTETYRLMSHRARIEYLLISFKKFLTLNHWYKCDKFPENDQFDRWVHNYQAYPLLLPKRCDCNDSQKMILNALADYQDKVYTDSFNFITEFLFYTENYQKEQPK